MHTQAMNILSTGLDIYNIIICLAMIFFLGYRAKKSRASFLFMMSVIFIIVFNISDLSNWLFEGKEPAWKVPALHILTFTFFAVVPFIFYYIIRYIEEYIRPCRISCFYLFFCIFTGCVFELCSIVSIFQNFFYQITPDNYYTRGRFNFLSTVLIALEFFNVFLVLLHYRKQFAKRVYIAFLSFIFFPFITQLMQVLWFYGLSLVNLGMTVSILLIFINSFLELEKHYEETEKLIKERDQKLIKIQEQTIVALSNLVENRDMETGQHAKRTSMFVEELARQTQKDGYYKDVLTDKYIEYMVMAAPMHDIGKIVVSDTILKKPGRLSIYEYDRMKIHAKEGARIVREVLVEDDSEEYVKIAAEMAQYHHEYWNGKGYPMGLKEQQIPLCARIMAIADVFDALVYERCYKKAMPVDEAYETILKESGTHFDPVLVEEFIKIRPQISRVLGMY
jgi:hypothetical protein